MRKAFFICFSFRIPSFICFSPHIKTSGFFIPFHSSFRSSTNKMFVTWRSLCGICNEDPCQCFYDKKFTDLKNKFLCNICQACPCECDTDDVFKHVPLKCYFCGNSDCPYDSLTVANSNNKSN